MSKQGAPNSSPLKFQTQFDAQTGVPVEVAAGLVRVCAGNSGPYTFTGTNTFLVGEQDLLIVDPGPDSPSHLTALLDAIGTRSVKAIALTHTHKDHSSLARKLAQALGGIGIWFGGAHRLSRPKKKLEINVLSGSCDWNLQPDHVLEDGERIQLQDMEVEVITTPGHCANHLAFGLVGTPHLLVGDHVMGWNSTLVAVPDGSMADYFSSIDRVSTSGFTRFHPAHGNSIENGPEFAQALGKHRELRNAQILDAIEAGHTRFGDIVDKIYPDVPPATRRAAAMTLQAHAEYLADKGQVKLECDLFGRPRKLRKT